MDLDELDHLIENDDTLTDLDIQGLIDSGLAWRLEGYVGRECMAAIEDGRAILGEVGHRDYWGNYVPSRFEVEPGTKGSIEYAEARA